MSMEFVGFELIASKVRANFDRVGGSRTRASVDLGLAPSIISHVLMGRTRSWGHLKRLTRWYRQNYPGFGDWAEIYQFFTRKFPQETEWNEFEAQ